MYYAKYCQWGIRVSYDSMNGNAYDFFAFEKKADRDAWTDKHRFDATISNVVSGPTHYKTVRSVMGTGFKLGRPDSDDFNAMKVWRKNDDEWEIRDWEENY